MQAESYRQHIRLDINHEELNKIWFVQLRMLPRIR